MKPESAKSIGTLAGNRLPKSEDDDRGRLWEKRKRSDESGQIGIRRCQIEGIEIRGKVVSRVRARDMVEEKLVHKRPSPDTVADEHR